MEGLDVAPGGPGALFLFGHKRGKAFFVDLDAFGGADLFGEVQREAIGIVEHEGVFAFEGILALDHLGKGLFARNEGAEELFFLALDHLGDEGDVALKFRIEIFVEFRDDGDEGMHEGLFDAKDPAITRSAAEQAAQDITPALVAKHRPIA